MKIVFNESSFMWLKRPCAQKQIKEIAVDLFGKLYVLLYPDDYLMQVQILDRYLLQA